MNMKASRMPMSDWNLSVENAQVRTEIVIMAAVKDHHELIGACLQEEGPARGQRGRGAQDQGADGVEAVGAAVEGEAWLVVPDVGHEAGDVVAADVREVGGDQIEGGGVHREGRQDMPTVLAKAVGRGVLGAAVGTGHVRRPTGCGSAAAC